MFHSILNRMLFKHVISDEKSAFHHDNISNNHRNFREVSGVAETRRVSNHSKSINNNSFSTSGER
jgi:hypothetical protein